MCSQFCAHFLQKRVKRGSEKTYRILRTTARTFLLDGTAEGLDRCGLRLCGGQVGTVGLGNVIEEAEVGDPGIVFQYCAYGVEFPERDLRFVRFWSRVDGAKGILGAEGRSYLL